MPPGRPPKEGAHRKPNPLRNRPPIKAPLPPIFQQKQDSAAAAAAKAAPRPARRACPNKTCSAPDVVDGVCHNCGTIVDDSNIVSEVQFGESSNGAAVVQGSFVSADQGTAKSLGPAFRRAGGMEDRESTIREGRRIMQALAGQLVIPESTIMSGVQIFKLAANNNFIQGRRMDMVAAVCLYSAARKESPCRVMLIDFADRLQVNVFKLGRTFKSLHKTITLSADGILPVLPEDLIYRFAEKLEFGEFRDKVAEDAIRMVQRMSMDWMVQGRRPSGVCGACLILAARMNNFRRTITEVVYIVKVTTHTIQKRLDEFKVTPSSALTVEEFLNNEFLETAHDPPSFYEKSEEWQKNKKKRKRRGHDGFDEEDENGENSGSNGEGEGGRSKRQKPTEPNPNPDQPVQSVELRRDADGFAIPPQPTQSHDIPIDPDLVDEAIADQTSTTFDKLVAQFGDIPDAPSNPDEDGDASSTTSAPKLRETRLVRAINVPDEWAAMEERMETEISEVINDPNTIYHAASYAKAQRRAAAHMLIAEKDNPSRNISMDVHIGEDEFADDPEVVNCILAEEEVRKKEKVWVNTNRDWLRKQQIKMWRQKQAENGPPKAKRNRKRKPRIGEGQTTAASSPAEAAINVMKERAFSKKINYNAIADIFKGISNLKNGDELGSAGTSRVTSQAGSDIGDSTEGSSRASSLAPSVAESVNSQASTGSNFLRVPKDHYVRRKKAAAASTTGTPRATSASPFAARVQSPAATDEGDDDDYVRPSPTPRARAQEPEDETEDWRSQVRNANQVGTGLDEEEEVLDDEEDYDDYGGVEAGGIPDDVSDRGFDLDDDEDIGFGDDD